MDLIRLVLLEAESDGELPELRDSYPVEEICYHIALALDANLVEGKVFKGSNGNYQAAVISRLTWEGHDFLDSVRDSTIWERAKSKLLKPGVSWTFAILKEILRLEARKALGYPETD